ncbi:MAG: helix-turn-helix domain-containing protein [Acidobacteriota bacterium]
MPSSSSCRIDVVLDVVSDLWTLGILHELSLGPRRPVELFGSFRGMSSKTLAARLKKLTRKGVLERKSYPEAPPRVEYSLTAKGRELLPIIKTIAAVALKWHSDSSKKNLPPCRACEIVFEEVESEAEASKPRPVQRRQTDVTLL